MTKKKQGCYLVCQSPLYKVTSKRKLADILKISVKDLRFLASLTDNYRHWELPQKRQEILAGLPEKKPRVIQQPKPLLDAVHRRLAQLLSRISKPSFVFSATKGLDYVDNARAHMNPHRGVKVDIKNFYASVRARLVRQFFEERLSCVPDVAKLLTQICCAGEFLPTGSAVSPLLSYFACSDLFARIHKMAAQKDLVFTLYVDDMMFSGEQATRLFASAVVKELAHYNFIGHKISYFPAGTVKVVTGVAVWSDRIGLPMSRYRKMRRYRAAFKNPKDYSDACLLGTTLMGQYREAERLHTGMRVHARMIESRLAVMRVRMSGSCSAAPPKPNIKRKKTVLLRRVSSAVAHLRARASSKKALALSCPMSDSGLKLRGALN
ncbi:reverse transcriptase family protein [Stenotrophomonas sp. Ker107b]